MGKTHPVKHRVLIVDDHPIFREGLCQMIERNSELVVCGEAPDAAQALKAVAQLKPDLVLVDITLEGSNGIDLIKNLKARHEELPILVISMHDESLYAERAVRAGAMGYVMKNQPAKTIRAAIFKVLGGDMFLSEKMSTTLLAKFVRRDKEAPASPLETLSDRELEVFQMIGQGKGTRQIAEELDLTIPTINSFRLRIKEKLQLNSGPELVLHAIQWFRERVARQ